MFKQRRRYGGASEGIGPSFTFTIRRLTSGPQVSPVVTISLLTLGRQVDFVDKRGAMHGVLTPMSW